MSTLLEFLERLQAITYHFLPELLIIIIILILGSFLIKFIRKIAAKLLSKNEVDPTFTTFILDAILWGLRILLFVIIASKLGIQTSSFVAIIGAMSLAIGLSLQGSLSNFAGGVLIILFKPFRIGDTIEAQGEIGKVESIQIFSTLILTEENKVIYIPNGILSNGKIKNLTKNDLTNSIITITSDKQDVSQVKSLLEEEVSKIPHILKYPKTYIYISDLKDNVVFYNICYSTKNEDVLEAKSQLLLACKKISEKS